MLAVSLLIYPVHSDLCLLNECALSIYQRQVDWDIGSDMFLKIDFRVYKDSTIDNEKKAMKHLSGTVLVFSRCVYDKVQNVNRS